MLQDMLHLDDAERAVCEEMLVQNISWERQEGDMRHCPNTDLLRG